MNKCETKDCPLKDNCRRVPKKGETGHIWIFTESPGAYRNVSGKKVWVCDKQLKIEQ
jgi:hypothetical protein